MLLENRQSLVQSVRVASSQRGVHSLYSRDRNFPGEQGGEVKASQFPDNILLYQYICTLCISIYQTLR
jgi:hypothetical protein